MKKIFRFLALPLFGILFGCASGQLKTTQIDNGESIIVARAFINNNGKMINTKWNFLWDERLWGKDAVWLENDGYVFMKLSSGKHFISLLQYNQYSKNIPDNYLSVDLEENKIYYIGDLTFNWNVSKEDTAKMGVVGVLVDSKKNDGKIQIDVIDNYDMTVKQFNDKYGNSKPIEKQLVKIE